MSAESLVLELTNIFKGPPDALAFSAIRAIFDVWPKGNSRDQAIKDAAVALQAWPDSARSISVRGHVLEAYARSPSWSLVRQLAITDLLDHESELLAGIDFQNMRAFSAPRGLKADHFKEVSQSNRFRNVVEFSVGGFEPASDYVDEEDGDLLAEPVAAANGLDVEAIYQEYWQALGPGEWCGRLRKCNLYWPELLKLCGDRGLPELEHVEIGFSLAACPPESLAKLTRERFPKLHSLAYGREDRTLFEHFSENRTLAGQLRRLWLYDCTYNNKIEILAECDSLQGLKHLSLNDYQVECESIRALNETEFADQLATLELHFPRGNDDPNEKLDESVWRNLASSRFSQLESFQLQMLQPGAPNDLSVFANASWLTGLVDLRLKIPKLENAGNVVARLDGSKLKKLSLDGAENADGIARAIQDNRSLQRFDELEVSSLGADGVKWICDSGIRSVQKLSLRLANEFKEDVAGLLSQWPVLQKTRELNLSFCDLGDKSLESLLNGNPFEQLRLFNLDGHQLTEAGIGYLSNAYCLKSLWVLKVAPGIGVGFSDQSAHQLAKSDVLASLHHLEVDMQALSRHAETGLANSPNLSRLESIETMNQRKVWSQGKHLRAVLRSTAAAPYPGNSWEEDR